MLGAFTQRFGQWLAIAAMLGFGFAFAQSEPTLNQVYEAAQSGKMDQAQTMIQQVLVAHPNSAKAHFVQAELFAKQGLNGRASDMLATADKLSPGLPFAKAEAVQSLRAKISARPVQQASSNGNSSTSHLNTSVGPASSASSFSWGTPLLLAGGVMLIGYFLFRRKNPPVEFHAQQPYANQANQAPVGSQPGNGLSGPQTFGMGGPSAAAPGYAQPPASGGMGRNIAGGLATGLAVGAGMMAAQAIGKSLMGNNEASHDSSSRLANNNSNNYEPIADNNSNMGGQNFGVTDNGSWDDGGSADVGGGDWDS
ncbi:MAG: tetratricopeptide repeat protein [Polaromonas sp.]|nr:tetratricopeptide repeat protein [Polaromonas sp.]